MSRKEKPTTADPALQASWTSACELYEHLAGGGELGPMPPGPIRLEQNEVGHGFGVLGYSRYYGTTVRYNQSSSFWFGSAGFVAAGMAAEAIGNASARRRAEAMSRAQWRDHAQVRTMLTNRRLLCDYQTRWLSFWHNGIVEFACDLRQWSFVLRYEVGEPLMLHGPAAPWFAIAVAWLAYGPQGLLMPAFAPFGQALSYRRHAITDGSDSGTG